MIKTRQIARGLNEFSTGQCLKAVYMNEVQGCGANTIANNLLEVTMLNSMNRSQITYAGERLINTGRYINYKNETRGRLFD